MIGGLALKCVAALALAYAVLVLRAAPRRLENRLCAALAALDGIQVGWRGGMVLIGYRISDPTVLLPCSLATMGLAVLSAELLWRITDDAPLPRPLRWGLIGGSLLAATTLVFTGYDTTYNRLAQELYFTPVTLVIALIGVRTLVRSERLGVRLIAGALIFRWLFGHMVYVVGKPFGLLDELLWAESTAAVLVSFVMIGHAILRDQLFSVRGAVSSAVGTAMLGLTVVAITATAVGGVMAGLPPGAAQHVALVAVAFVPLLLFASGRALYPRLETRLAALDDRRAARLEALAAPLADDAATAVHEGTARLTAMTGGDVRWLETPPAALASLLIAAPEPDLRPGVDPAIDAALSTLGADLVVAARLGGDVLGAWAMRGGTIDRDTLLVARAIAGPVAIALDRQRVLGQLEESRRLAALGQFAAAIAHDIRTPMQSVTMNLQILRRKSGLPADDLEYFDIALEEVGRLQRSVAEILDYAKPVRIAAAALDVRELVDDTARGLSPVLHEKGLSLTCDHGATLPPVVADPQRLRQVLVNLIDNAAGASSPGAIVVLRTRHDADRVVIDVEDRGRGIADGDLARIFEPFFTTRSDGTGLGLAICQKLVRAHGGELRVRSAPGQGSTFSVILPA